MSKSAKLIILTGIISSAFAVALGAFGAHGLKQLLSVYSLQIYQTAVNYQMWHSIAMILIGLSLQFSQSSRFFTMSAWLMLFGIFLFSGSLYALAMTELRWFGMITPLGGFCFLIGWTLFAVGIFRAPVSNH